MLLQLRPLTRHTLGLRRTTQATRVLSAKFPSLPYKTSSLVHTFTTSSINRAPVSEPLKMEAKQSNANFKLENLFNVKDKGISPPMNTCTIL